MLKAFFLSVTALIITGQTAFAQSDSISLAKLHFQLQQQAGNVDNKFSTGQTPEIKAGIQSFIDAVDSYILHVSVNTKGEFHKDAIWRDIQLLDSLNHKTQFDTSIIFYVRDDLTLKTKLNSLGLDSKKGGDIIVKIYTKRLENNTLTSATGYYVYWNYWLDKNQIKPRGNFQNPTNPFAVGYLSPGYYDFWVQKAGGTSREPLDHISRKMVIDPSQPDNLTVTIIVK